MEQYEQCKSTNFQLVMHLGLVSTQITALFKLLCAMNSSSRPDGVYEVSPELLTRRVQHFNSVLEKFWKRWREEYLLGLRELHQHSEGNSKAGRISV